LTDDGQIIIGYNHKITQRELNQGYIPLRNGENVAVNGLIGYETRITKSQAKVLLDMDIVNTIVSARDSIGSTTWDSLTVPQKAGLVLNAYHLGTRTDFEKSGVRSAVTSGDVIRAAQLLSSEMLKSSTGKYLKSEEGIAHIAASLFKSIPRSSIASTRANTALNTSPVIVAGAGIGVQVHESNIAEDENALSLKYPTPEEIGKSSLSDLVSYEDKTLIQKFRERSPVSAIGANNESWTEPSPAYSAEYPHNKVKETESGHVFEMDDTPYNERVHLAHRSGSFIEWYPSGTKVEKVVKNNYKLVMSDDHIYVAGKVNVVLESNAHVKIVGDCFLQVENDLNASVSGNVNFSVGDAFNIKANTLKFDIAQTSTIIAATHSTTGSPLTITAPPRRGTPTATQKFLEADKVVKLSDDIIRDNNRILKDYLANPYNFPATYRNVKRYIATSPKSGSDLIYKNTVGESLILINETANISKWLDKQLELAANGYWRETGFELTGEIQPSNPNILSMWRNLGFTLEYWTQSDQTVWAMAFVNYGLKQNGYRYVQTPHPRDLEIRFEDYRFSRVKPEDARAGDVVLWANDHVNFVYENINGTLRFVGGAQPPDSRLDIGDGRIGDVSIVGDGGCPIVTILRPSNT
jgi:GH24 family phage-related lysozyme (muramidase)